MGHKVFVSYKYKDAKVQSLVGPNNMNDSVSVLASLSSTTTTVRQYVDKIIDIMGDSVNIYKGEEDGNDLSAFSDDTIATKLKDKIKDSSVTIVLISKGMKTDEDENDQWIPWEISYSLKEISSDVRTSKSNGLLAVILPDENGSYEYYLEECPYCSVCRHKTEKLFQILRNNMFNLKDKKQYPSTCARGHGMVNKGMDHSYAYQVKWDDFIKNHEYYINHVVNLRDNIDNYDIQKVVMKPVAN